VGLVEATAGPPVVDEGGSSHRIDIRTNRYSDEQVHLC
jgi:hypothetical protein